MTPGVGLTQDITNVAEHPRAGDQFGRRLVLAPPGLSDTKTRLAVCTLRGPLGWRRRWAGPELPLMILVQKRPTTRARPVPTPPLKASVAANDRFGEGLGFVAGKTERSILIGVPDDREFSSGMVHVLPLPSGVPRSWRPGVGGVPSAGADRFGGAAGGECSSSQSRSRRGRTVRSGCCQPRFGRESSASPRR